MILDLDARQHGQGLPSRTPAADANENAIKIARMYTGRNKIFSRYRSYHGSTFGAGTSPVSRDATLSSRAFRDS